MNSFKKLALLAFLLPLFFVVSSFFTQKAHAATFTFSGYPFIDNGTGNHAGNGIKDSEEKCFKGEYTVQIPGVTPKTVVGKEDCSVKYSISKTTPDSSVSFRLWVPTGYSATKLSYVIPPSLAINVDDGSSVNLSKSGIVNFGLKEKSNCNAKPSLTNPNSGKKVNANNIVYDLKLVNNDDAGCPVTTFNLAAVLPNVITWRSQFLSSGDNELPSKINLGTNPRSFNFKIKVTPPSDAAPGNPTIKVLAGGSGVAGDSVDVIYPIAAPSSTPNCDRNPPLLEVTEPQNGERSGKRGEERKYTIRVTNKDSGQCDDVNFVLTKEGIPNNFNVSFDDPTLTIGKGAHKSTVLHATPQNDATNERKTITVGLKRQGKEIAKTHNVFYTVEANNPSPTNKPTHKPTSKPTNKPTPKPTKKPTNGPTPTNCQRKTLEFIVTPDSREAEAGEAVKYTMVITNKDEGPCGTRKLSFGAKLPSSSWRSVFAKENFELAKGGEATIDVAITSPNGATSGSKKITLNVKNTNGAVVSTKDVIYVVPSTSTNCGGIAGLSCPAGYTCQYQNTPPNPDESGICVITSPHPTSTPTCTPRPACLDSNPPCRIAETLDMCPPTPTPPPGSTLLNIKIGLDGIGYTPRIPIGGNKNPLNENRTLNIRYFDASSNTEAGSAEETVTYNPTSQQFEVLTEIPNLLPSGIYNIYVDSARFLNTQYPGSVNITAGQTVNLTSGNFYMITGNINNTDISENRIDIMDYNVLISCSIYSQNSSNCDEDPNYATYSDLNDDGRVDEDDYTLFLKEFGNQQGIIIP